MTSAIKHNQIKSKEWNNDFRLSIAFLTHWPLTLENWIALNWDGLSSFLYCRSWSIFIPLGWRRTSSTPRAATTLSLSLSPKSLWYPPHLSWCIILVQQQRNRRTTCFPTPVVVSDRPRSRWALDCTFTPLSFFSPPKIPISMAYSTELYTHFKLKYNVNINSVFKCFEKTKTMAFIALCYFVLLHWLRNWFAIDQLTMYCNLIMKYYILLLIANWFHWLSIQIDY